jgi:hypothetical protein
MQPLIVASNPAHPYRREYLSMADRPSSGDRLKLFIFYSRRDMAAADALVTALDGASQSQRARNRKFADSLLEGGGFEPLVPRGAAIV